MGLCFRTGCAALTALMAGFSQPGLAEYDRPGEERFKFGAGSYFQRYDTTVRVKDSNGGAFLNLEDDLGYDSDDSGLWLGGHWRFAKRHRLGLSYFDSKRSVTAIAQEDIDIGEDETIPAGAGYESDFRIRVVPLQYAYSFVQNDKFELAGTVGMHWYAIDYDIGGAAGIGNTTVSDSVDVEADAPMPLLGLGFDYYITRRWHLNMLGEVFYLAVSAGDLNFEGSVLNTRIGTEYWLWDRVGIGAALNWFSLNVSVDDSQWNGDLEYDYWGPQVYVTARY